MVIGTFILYIIIIVYTSFMAWVTSLAKKKETKIVFSLVTITVPTFFASLRYNVGTDYQTYADYFRGVFSRESFEFLFKFIVSFFQRITNNPSIYFMVFTIVIFYFILKGLFYYKKKFNINIGIAMMAFILIFYFISYNILRQIVAVAIIFYATKYIFEKNLFRFAIYILIASGFHISSLLVIPFYFFYQMTKSNKNLFLFISSIILVLVAILNADIILLNVSRVIPGMYYYYGYFSQKSISFNILNRLLRSITYIVLFYFVVKNTEFKRREITTLYLMYIVSVLFSISSQIYVSDVTSRLSYPLESSLIVLIPFAIKYYWKNNKVIPATIIFLFPLIEFIFDTFIKGYADLIPYQTVF